MKAYVFPGQGSQFPGMGGQLYESSNQAKKYFEQANDILGFRITDLMFGQNAEDLKQTRVTQPAVFIHSVIQYIVLEKVQPDMVAGHSLGEFSALTAIKSIDFEHALRLVSARALAMQKACEETLSGMAAVLGLDDTLVEEILKNIPGVVVAANYNSPGQLVISGELDALDLATEALKVKGAKRVIPLPVSGAFHSPLMESARKTLAQAIDKVTFSEPICPIYQNVSAEAIKDPILIKQNLIAQLTAPVKWTQSIRKMKADGANYFLELPPGKVLQGLIKKIEPSVHVSSLS